MTFDGWVPARVVRRDEQPGIEWIWMGERRFREPFFADTLNLALEDPFALLFRRETPIEALQEWSEIRPGLKPDGLIFHMSRCGSTLITQLLSCLSDAVALSEPPPLDDLLRGPARSDEQRRAWVEWLIRALGQRRSGETRYFLKLDCWHMRYLPILRRALPGVPWIFVYRDPAEVLASHQNVPALWSVPGMLDPKWIGAELAEVIRMDRLEFCARMMEQICDLAWSFRGDELGRFVNYSELPEAVWASIATRFGMTFTSAETAAMRQQANFQAKAPGLWFERDGDGKRARLSSRAAELADRHLYPTYHRLESARTHFQEGEAEVARLS